MGIDQGCRANQRIGRATGPLGKVDRQCGGYFLVLCLAHRHRDARVVVFQTWHALAPEMSRAGVALVDLLCVCQMQPRHGGEFFCGGCEVGKDGGTSAGADVEDLGFGSVFFWLGCIIVAILRLNAAETIGKEVGFTFCKQQKNTTSQPMIFFLQSNPMGWEDLQH